jgi:uncharacterized protein (TIRG00374 family)
MRKTWFQWIRIGIAGLLILCLITWVDFEETIGILARTKLRYVLLIILLSFFDRFLMSYKWNILLKAGGIGLTASEAFKIYLASGFVGTFLPTGIGADVFRAVRTKVGGRKIHIITASIVVERVIGLSAVILLALIGLRILISHKENQFLGLYYLIWILFILFLIGLSFSIQPGLTKVFKRQTLQFQRYKMAQMYLGFHEAYLTLSRHRQALLLFFFLSFCEQVMQSVILCAAARAMGISASAVYFLAFSPLTMLIITLPISIHGIGVLEGSYVLLFGLAGLSPAESLSMSLLFRVIEFTVLLPAGIVFLCDSVSFKQLRQPF